MNLTPRFEYSFSCELRRASTLVLYFAIAVFFWLGSRGVYCQEPIVLRDLTVIRGKSVVGFDETAVKLSDGSELTWDQILKAQVDSTDQAEFDSKIEKIGLPLFRLKSRVVNHDWAGAEELAEQLYSSLAAERLESLDSSNSSYLICYAVMQSRLDRGDRPGAVVPFLQTAHIQRLRRGMGENVGFLPETDVATMLSVEVLPIWFESAKVERAFDSLVKLFEPEEATEEVGAIVYLASMSIEMGRLEFAENLIKLLENRGDRWEQWRIILQVQLAIAEKQMDRAARLLERRPSEFWGAAAPLAIYLRYVKYFRPLDNRKSGTVAMQETQPSLDRQNQIEESSRAMLGLLEIAATWGEEHRDLAAAALYQTAQIARSLDWSHECEVLEQELRLRFPNSHFSRLVKNRLLEKEN